MTFSQQVKQELVRLKPEKNCCMLSELSAITQALGSMTLMGGGRFHVNYPIQSMGLAKRVFLLLKLRLAIIPTIEYTKLPRLGGQRVCTLTVRDQDAKRLLTALHMLRPSEDGDVFCSVPRGALSRRCCRQAFLRGAFLGAGAMNNPDKGYHMEFIAASPKRAAMLMSIMEKCGVTAALIQRRGDSVAYVKKGDDVVALLGLMGAHQALMEMENIRIRRESRNQANRALNCDQANMLKQLAAARSQAEAIAAYSLNNGLGGLPKPLDELARLRLLNPDVSLEQLGQMTTPPLGKSGVNYRMRKLMALIRPCPSSQSEESK